MKAFVIAAALFGATSIAPAGAARDARAPDATAPTATAVMADAGQLGAARLTALNGTAEAPWSTTQREAGLDLERLAEVDAGLLLVGLGIVGIAVARPVGRVLRRHEQHRRATALASTLGQPPRG